MKKSSQFVVIMPTNGQTDKHTSKPTCVGINVVAAERNGEIRREAYTFQRR